MHDRPFSRIANKPLFHIVLIAVLGLVVYSNTFKASFHFDDRPFIIDNPFIKDFGYFIDPSKVDLEAKSLYLSPDVTRFFKTRRVGYLTLWASYRLGGLNVEGYHAVNLALHIINALLVYLIVTLTFRTPFFSSSRFKERSHLIALFSGLLFVAHPLQTEVVTYIIERVVLLAAMFYLASTAAYIGARLSNGRVKYGLYALALLFAVLGMKTKENVFTLPVAIAIYEFMFFRGSIKRRALWLVPLLLTMLIIPLEYIDLNSDAGLATIIESATRYPDAPPRLDYLFTQFSVVSAYMRLLLFPVGQTIDHDHPVLHSFFEPQVFLPFLLLVSVFGLGVYMFRRLRTGEAAGRLAAFGIFWFFIAISVESSVLPIEEMMVEYRVYLPSAGFLTTGVVLYFFMADFIGRRMPLIKRSLVPVLALVTLALAGAAHARNTVWADELSLWKDAVRKSPGNSRAHSSLGTAYFDKDNVEKAIKHFEVAVDLAPDYALAQYNLGKSYAAKGLLDKARKQYELAISLDPTAPRPYINLGIIYKSRGLVDLAIENYQRAMRLDPNIHEAHYNIGNAYMLKGMAAMAVRHYEQAIRLKPDYADAHNNLGMAYRHIGLSGKADEEFRAVQRLQQAR